MDVYKKIEREKALINAANLMRQQTNNDAVRSKLDNQMREGRRNLEFFEGKLRELQMRKMNQGMENMALSPASNVSGRPRSADLRSPQDGPPTPPPKDGSGSWQDQGSYGHAGYMSPMGEMMPSQHPFPAQAPGAGMPKPRPNFTKLGQ